jgi:hypothetical protein
MKGTDDKVGFEWVVGTKKGGEKLDIAVSVQVL